MNRILLRIEHLHRLTDPRGLIRSAMGDCPDRSAGFDCLSNADALRFCALASGSSANSELPALANIYFKLLSRARRFDGRINRACSSLGVWRELGCAGTGSSGPGADDILIQSRLARALAAVMVSELPIPLRMAAADWWPALLRHAPAAHTPVAAANWLIAIGTLRAADPGRNLQVVETLANRLVEDCYYAIRSIDWEWFESHWVPAAADLPAGLWYAHRLLGQRRLSVIARRTTGFIIEQLFENGIFMPPGTRGGWHRHTSKGAYDQLPADAASTVELMQAAADASGEAQYHRYAESAAAWFTGQNICRQSLIDPQTGGCSNAIRPSGPSPNQGAAATVAWLLTQVSLYAKTPLAAHCEENACQLVG